MMKMKNNMNISSSDIAGNLSSIDMARFAGDIVKF